MGFVYVDAIIHGMKGSKAIKMLVDTGSTYIVIDPRTISELGLVETPYKVKVTLADGSHVEVRLYLAEVEVKGRKGPAFIAELDTPTPLLGVYALETLGFKVNPRTGELEEMSPEGGYILSV
ncbi:MAG: retroviral-like aspartic protease family protein [Thermoprotei archaeon]|nr:retroviral-like aspartic protease family protein [Thermoprotei archaeon]